MQDQSWSTKYVAQGQHDIEDRCIACNVAGLPRCSHTVCHAILMQSHSSIVLAFGLWKTSSLVLHILTFNLLSSDHLSLFSNSLPISISYYSCTNKLESSGYLVIWLVNPNGCRSIMQTVNKVGLIPDPCTIYRLITRINNHFSPILTNCV